jgi:hypothetical protein
MCSCFRPALGATLWSSVSAPGASYWNRTHRFLGGGEDIDADGIDDFGVGGFWSNVEHTTRVYSGATQQLIRTIGLPPLDPAESGFAFVGDLDGDARSEIAYTTKNGGQWRVPIVSGATGAVLRTCVPSPALSSLNVWDIRVAALGDIDGDSVSDLAIASWEADRVHVFSGATGAQIRVHASAQPGVSFGRSIAGRLDCDGDGIGDVLVGAPFEPDGSGGLGTATVFSGRTGVQILETNYGLVYGRAGSSVAPAGDVNADGFR